MEQSLPSLAILYLIREGESLQNLLTFLDSLPGELPEKVDVFVLIKNVTTSQFDSQISSIIDHYRHPVICTSLPDEGFDLGSYFKMASKLHHDLIMCMSSTSKFNKSFDPTVIANQFEDSAVGLIGAMVSRESIHSAFFNNRKNSLNSKLSKYINYKNIQDFVILVLTYVSFLLTIKQSKNYLNFPKFPNTSIRTTGFVIRRKLYIDIIKKMPTTKIETLQIESGKKSLYKQTIKKGFKALVFFQGHFFDPESHVASLTFRSNLLIPPMVSDHWWVHFAEASANEKQTLSISTWGK